MGDASVLLGIAAVQLVGAASPGPTFMIVSRYAVSRSRRGSLLAVAGVVLATATWATVSVSGLGLLIIRYPPAYLAVRACAAAYLVWLGASLLVAAALKQTRDDDGPDREEISGPHAFRAGFLTNMANPKSIGYYTSIFAVMLPGNGAAWLFGAAAGVAVSVSAAWWLAIALLLASAPVRKWYGRLRRRLDGATGGILICLGLRLALEG